jgi:hypothetical protein
MTMRSFGRVTPIHISMLELAGYVVDGRDMRPAAGDNEYLRTMRNGWAKLRRTTGKDFGYDLAAWREFLVTASKDEFGYRHPYAYRRVDGIVRSQIDDSRRAELVAKLKDS